MKHFNSFKNIPKNCGYFGQNNLKSCPRCNKSPNLVTLVAEKDKIKIDRKAETCEERTNRQNSLFWQKQTLEDVEDNFGVKRY